MSTKEQSPEMQLEALRRHAAQRDFEIVGEFVDVGISGAEVKRPELDKLVTAAWSGKLKVIMVWKFDRFARSLPHLLQSIDTFSRLGIDFLSLTEQFDTSTPIGRAMLAIIGAMAQLERDLIRERVSAGIARAKANGVHCGRPGREIPAEKWSEIFVLRQIGAGWRRIAEQTGVSRNTLRRAWAKNLLSDDGKNSPENLDLFPPRIAPNP